MNTLHAVLAAAVRPHWRATSVGGVLIAGGFALRDVWPPALPVLLVAATAVAGRAIVLRAIHDLRVRRVGIELLVTIAVAGALAIGEVWEAAAVTFLFSLGGAMEAMAIRRTRAALGALFDLVPETAIVHRDGAEIAVAPEDVAIGEVVVVRPGGRVPVDGEVLAGHAAVDESTVTGESVPVEKGPGDRVAAGTTTGGGVLKVRATAVGAATTLARIITRVEQAQESKARAQRLMERFARWYTPGIVALAAVALLVTWELELALTLLVIGCPGALVISMPVAVVAGIGRSARAGILVKGGEHLEQLGRVTAVALDKTGTLTRGRPRVTDVIALARGATERQVLGWAAATEAASEHPLARPIIEAAAERDITPSIDADGFVAHPGRGVEASIDGHRVAVGTPTLASALGVDLPVAATDSLARLRAAGRTAVLVVRDDAIVGTIAVADEVRPDARAALDRLRHAGIAELLMLTGDAEPVARSVAGQVGITDVRAEHSPEDKLDAIRDLQTRGHVVAMVGDGVNDAPALATADVGVAMGAGGTAVAVETADVALMADQLGRLADAVDLARRTTRVIRQNVVVALVTVAVLLTGVLAGRVHMAGGMLVHELSVLLVALNAVRLLRVRTGADRPADTGTTAPAAPRVTADPGSVEEVARG